MPRKLCWIEVDEEGKAVGPLERSGLSALVQRNVIEALPDATEEVVEAVAGAMYGDPLIFRGAAPWSREQWLNQARSLLTRLASAPLNKERKDA